MKDKGEWFVLELCEPLASLVDMTASFHEFEGERTVSTFITDGEKDPKVLGFAWQMRTFYNLVKELIQVAWMTLKLLLQRMLKFKV